MPLVRSAATWPGTTQAYSSLTVDEAKPTTVSFGLPGALVTVIVLPIRTGPENGPSVSMSISPGRVAHRPWVREMSSSGPPLDARPTTVSP